MSVDRRYTNLLNKLINANIDLAAYLQLRKAKGYMSVSENDHLRDNLFELCHELRVHAPRFAARHRAGRDGSLPPCRRVRRFGGGLPDERAS